MFYCYSLKMVEHGLDFGQREIQHLFLEVRTGFLCSQEKKKKSGETIGFSLNYQPFLSNVTVFMKTCVIGLYSHLSQCSDLATFYLLLIYWRELLILIT